jgi:hypothetical protein
MYKQLPNVHVVGIGYKARNGKDSTAAVFQEYFGSAARRYAFADHLRSICRVEHGMTVKDAELLQRMGTDVYRVKDPEVWVRSTYWTIAEQAPEIAIVSDVRFPNEAQMVKDMGGTLIKCVRREPNGQQFIDPSRSATHPSETAMDGYTGWDYEIDACGIAQLEYQAVNICDEIAKKIGYAV